MSARRRSPKASGKASSRKKGKDKDASHEEPVARRDVFLFPDGSRYDGEYVVTDTGVTRTGEGTLLLNNGASYKGSWQSDLPHGQGEMSFVDGTLYKGGFVNGRFHGSGTYTFADGTVYEGYFKNSKCCVHHSWAIVHVTASHPHPQTAICTPFARPRCRAIPTLFRATLVEHTIAYLITSFLVDLPPLSFLIFGAVVAGTFLFRPDGDGKYTDSSKITWKGPFRDGKGVLTPIF